MDSDEMTLWVDTVEKAGCPLGVVPLGCFEAALLG
jgi:hypothetical protein